MRVTYYIEDLADRQVVVGRLENGSGVVMALVEGDVSTERRVELVDAMTKLVAIALNAKTQSVSTSESQA